MRVGGGAEGAGTALVFVGQTLPVIDLLYMVRVFEEHGASGLASRVVVHKSAQVGAGRRLLEQSKVKQLGM
jgi:hypothetical protein